MSRHAAPTASGAPRAQSVGGLAAARAAAPDLLLVILIGLCVAAPYLKRGLPVSVDTFLHLYRLPHFDALLSAGVVYPRWWPAMIYGYGFPQLNFYSPLAYYVIQAFHGLGFSLLAAYKLYWIGGVFLAAAGMYGWLRDVAGRLAGATAALAYVASPFFVYEIYQRAGLSQYAGYVVAPFAFWFLQRSIAQPARRADQLAAALAIGALIAAHNVTALIVVPFLMLYALALLLAHLPAAPGAIARAAWHALWPAVLGLALAAWYWLPALGETRFIQVERVTQSGVLSYADHFVRLGELFSGALFYDALQLNRQPPRSFHLLVLVLLVVGVLRALWRRERSNLVHAFVAVVTLVVSIFMMLPQSTPVWENVPLIKMVQFPHRFWGVASLWLAPAAAFGVVALAEVLRATRWRAALLAAIFLAIPLYSAPWSYKPFTPVTSPTLADSVRYEFESGLLGLSTAAEYLPTAVRALPTVDNWHVALRANRLITGTLPAGAVATPIAFTPLTQALTVETPVPFTAEFAIFYFPGWQASLDGVPVPVTASAPHGLISFPVPAGTHTVQVAFTTTPLRRVGSALTLAAASVWLIVLLLPGRRRAPAAPADALPWRALGVALLLFVGLRLTWLELDLARRSRYAAASFDRVAQLAPVNFGDRLALIGYTSNAPEPADAPLAVTLYWRAQAPIGEDYSVQLSIVGADGVVVASSGKIHIGDFPTRRWPLGQYAADLHFLTPAPGTPPGDYALELYVYRYEQPDAPLGVRDAAGNPAGNTAQIGRVVLDRPRRSATIAQLDGVQPADWLLTPAVRLAAYRPFTQRVNTGEPIFFDLYWSALRESATPVAMQIVLLADGTPPQPLAPLAPLPALPTTAWRAGDFWWARHVLLMPATLASGSYRVALQAAADGTDAPLTIGRVDVTAPPHVMTPPPVALPIGARLGDVAELLGASVAPAADGQTSVTLVWRALSGTTRSYRSFVQLLTADGRYVSGSDQIPATWQRPTTGWIVDEYIVDQHLLSVPATGGPFQLVAGLYDGASGQRLTTTGGADSVPVAPWPPR